MEKIIVFPENKEDMELLQKVLEKMEIHYDLISEERMEDIGFGKMMMEVDKNKLVSEEDVMNIVKFT